MKNRFIKHEEEGYVEILLDSNTHRNKVAYVDLNDFDLVDSVDRKWTLSTSSDDKYYATTSINNELVYMHKLIMGVSNEDEVNIVVNNDRNRLNNRRSNLTITTRNIRFRNCKIPNSKGSDLPVGISQAKDNKGMPRIVAQYKDFKGKDHCKSFSANKYGYNAALKMALEHRLYNGKIYGYDPSSIYKYAKENDIELNVL